MVLVRRVVGASMVPTLRPGQVIVFWRSQPAAGTIAIATVNGREVVKRVAAVKAAGVWLLGDNPAFSTDSRQFGLVPHGAIRGRLIWPRKAQAPTRWLEKAA